MIDVVLRPELLSPLVKLVLLVRVSAMLTLLAVVSEVRVEVRLVKNEAVLGLRMPKFEAQPGEGKRLTMFVELLAATTGELRAC